MWIRNVRVTETIPENIGASPLVEATVSRSRDGKSYSLLVINKSMKEAEPVLIELPGAVKQVKAEVLSGPSVDAVNEENPENVIIRPLKTETGNGGVRALLPPHSFSGFTITVQ